MPEYKTDLDTKFMPIGALWNSPPGKKSVASGSIYINGRKVRIIVLVMDEKTKAKLKTDRKPDLTVMADVPNDMDLGFRTFREEADPQRDEPGSEG